MILCTCIQTKNKMNYITHTPLRVRLLKKNAITKMENSHLFGR